MKRTLPSSDVTAMVGEGSLAQNTLAMFLARTVSPILSLLLVLAVARALGTSGLGEYSLVMGFLVIFQVVASLGLLGLLVREVARNKARVDEYFASSATVLLAAAFVSLLAMDLAIALLGYAPEVKRAAYIASLSLVPYAVILVCDAILIAFGKMKYIACVALSEALTQIAPSLVFLLLGYGVAVLMMVFVGSRFLSMLLYLLFLRRAGILKSALKIDPRLCRDIIVAAPIFAGLVGLAGIFMRADILILAGLRDTTEVGLYSVARRLMEAALFLPQSAAIPLYPLMCRLHSSSHQEFRSLCDKALGYLLVAAFPMAIGGILLSDRLIALLFTPSFAASSVAFQILMMSLLAGSLDIGLSYGLLARNREFANLMALVVALLSNIIGNFLLVPPFGFVGSSIAWLISMALLAGLRLAFFWRALYKPALAKPLRNATIAGAGMALFLLLAREANLALLIFGSGGLYFLVLFLLGQFSSEDLRFLCVLRGERAGFGENPRP